MAANLFHNGDESRNLSEIVSFLYWFCTIILIGTINNKILKNVKNIKRT